MTYQSFQQVKSGERGFTLVELSIVLVIIGLIVGGVLVGQDLIRAAQVRATIAQIEKFNSAVNAFRDKYGQLPGDLTRAQAFLSVSTPNGNGNGLINDTNATGINITQAAGEITTFWQHLSVSNMIQGNFSGAQSGGTVEGASATPAFPRTKLDRGGFSVYNAGGFNHYQIGVANANGTAAVFANSLKPEEANGIDTKLDDGDPTAGIAIARGTTTGASGTGPNLAASAGTGGAGGAHCVKNNVTPNIYNLANPAILCQLRIRFN